MAVTVTVTVTVTVFLRVNPDLGQSCTFGPVGAATRPCTWGLASVLSLKALPS